MSQVFSHFLSLLRLTLSDAQSGARAVLGGALPAQAMWTLFLLVMALSGFLSQLTLLLVPFEGEEVLIPGSGFFLGFMVGGVILLMSVCIRWIGRAFDGTGTMRETILLIIWLQYVMVAVQVVQTALALIAPGLGVLVGWIGMGLMFWLLTNFIAVLHGFKSLGMVFFMILASAVGVAFGVSLLLAIVSIFIPLGV